MQHMALMENKAFFLHIVVLRVENFETNITCVWNIQMLFLKM